MLQEEPISKFAPVGIVKNLVICINGIKELIKMSEKEIVLEKCFCGAVPELKKERVCYGHGDFADKYYVECSCGLRGMTFSDRCYSVPDVHAVNWWQDLIQIYKE